MKKSDNASANVNKVRKVRAKVATTYDVDIAQEFKDVKQEFKLEFKEIRSKLDEWKTVFDRQLTQLNDNMRNVMEKIAQHEFRFTEHEKRIRTLEDTGIKTETRAKTVSDMAKFGWTTAKVLLIVGALIGTVGGCGWLLKIMSII